MNDALPVADLIIRRGMKVDERCQNCGLDGESIQHVLFDCGPARYVWALSGIPQPEGGFEAGNLFSNIDYLLNIRKITRGENEDKRAWPWIIWFLWKSRNDLLFKGTRWSPEEISLKAKTESVEWFLAQQVENEVSLESRIEGKQKVRKWLPPPRDWLMCNVAFEWDRNTSGLGVAWVVRNHRGVVTIHSRKAFSHIQSLDQARFVTCQWAVESMTSLHMNKVVFAGDFKDLFLAIQKPQHWPALRYQSDELNRFFVLMEEYQLKWVSPKENRGAAFIAQSVTRQGRNQSYVASGHPEWLFEFFVNESRAF